MSNRAKTRGPGEKTEYLCRHGMCAEKGTTRGQAGGSDDHLSTRTFHPAPKEKRKTKHRNVGHQVCARQAGGRCAVNSSGRGPLKNLARGGVICVSRAPHFRGVLAPGDASDVGGRCLRRSRILALAPASVSRAPRIDRNASASAWNLATRRAAVGVGEDVPSRIEAGARRRRQA